MAKHDEEFSFETIANVYREERKQTTLTKLPLHFYRNLGNYIERLQKGYLSARKENPNSPKTMMLEDEYERSQKRANQIYEYRERKLTSLALSVANGGNPNMSALTAEERRALEELVETLTTNRSKILLTEAGDSCEPEKTSENQEEVEIEKDDVETVQQSTSPSQKELLENETYDTGDELSHEENSVILVLDDIPSFSTEDRILNLKKDDVISLPKRYANILCRNQKAKVIRGN